MKENIWEEKNLIDQSMNCENNQMFGQNDIIEKINTKSVKNECKIIGNRKKWKWNCPRCGTSKFYKYESRVKYANDSNRHCGSCSKILFYEKRNNDDEFFELIDNVKMYYRFCPKCNDKLYYKQKSHRNQTKELNQSCRKCFFNKKNKMEIANRKKLLEM